VVHFPSFLLQEFIASQQESSEGLVKVFMFSPNINISLNVCLRTLAVQIRAGGSTVQRNLLNCKA
jgi:hypothetical protein